jgi:hypothetical protein
MLPTAHKAAAGLATATIATFWLSTVISELFLDHGTIAAVKTLILYGFAILIPAMAVAGGTGFKLAKGRTKGIPGTKSKRMPFVAANGLLILIPSAVFLAGKAQAGEFDAAFYVVQGVELLAGATNLALLGLNIRDGRRMTAGKRRRAAMMRQDSQNAA